MSYNVEDLQRMSMTQLRKLAFAHFTKQNYIDMLAKINPPVKAVKTGNSDLDVLVSGLATTLNTPVTNLVVKKTDGIITIHQKMGRSKYIVLKVDKNGDIYPSKARIPVGNIHKINYKFITNISRHGYDGLKNLFVIPERTKRPATTSVPVKGGHKWYVGQILVHRTIGGDVRFSQITRVTNCKVFVKQVMQTKEYAPLKDKFVRDRVYTMTKQPDGTLKSTYMHQIQDFDKYKVVKTQWSANVVER